jgi:hypothetical protein
MWMDIKERNKSMEKNISQAQISREGSLKGKKSIGNLGNKA